MATVITFTIPSNAYGQKALDDFAIKYGYTGLNNNTDKIAFLKAKTIEWWMEAVVSTEANNAASTAFTNASLDITTNLTIT